jgi:hypothetical protein
MRPRGKRNRYVIARRNGFHGGFGNAFDQILAFMVS